MKAAPSTLAAAWDPDSATVVPSNTDLKKARRMLHCATLPATVEALDRVSKFGGQRLRSCLAVLEARGEVTLNRRGDTVFTINGPPPWPNPATANPAPATRRPTT